MIRISRDTSLLKTLSILLLSVLVWTTVMPYCSVVFDMECFELCDSSDKEKDLEENEEKKDKIINFFDLKKLNSGIFFCSNATSIFLITPHFLEIPTPPPESALFS